MEGVINFDQLPPLYRITFATYCKSLLLASERVRMAFVGSPTARQSLRKWEPKLKVKVNSYFLQRMKTKWGSCNHRLGIVRLNTELVKKPKDLLEYVILHEMVHLLEPTPSDRFIEILSKHYPLGVKLVPNRTILL